MEQPPPELSKEVLRGGEAKSKKKKEVLRGREAKSKKKILSMSSERQFSLTGSRTPVSRALSNDKRKS